ncbi:alpha/beta-hydrolase [Penicillium angulare]|uniref:Alpha/beta-hydrolase n=1 Tax=Penicillium angulare TaxID=116970 RepID=A0A9W9G098_9EURO|nr:alpha/beta-hydrolase [Penicillium angulare]
MTTNKPTFVLVPGGSQNPAQYGYLLHLLQAAGYGATSALLPSLAPSDTVTAADDAEFIRSRMILPVLDIGKQDVILIMHSYSGMPGSAAALGLGKSDRAIEGKSTSVIGQIFIASIVPRGGDGLNIIDGFGGQLPPHMYIDREKNLVCCDDPKPWLFYDILDELADGTTRGSLSHGLDVFTSPCPVASWKTEPFKDRVAYIHTLNDKAIPYEAQCAMVEATGEKWITKEIKSGHSPQLGVPEELAKIILGITEQITSL